MGGLQIEREAKFFVADPRDLETVPELLRILRVSPGVETVETLDDLYVDTPDRLFLRAGLGFRVRRSADHVILTVKTRATADAVLAQRFELEETLPAAAVRIPGPLPGRRIAAWFREAFPRARVAPLVRLRHIRKDHRVALGDDTSVKVSADWVRLMNPGPGPGFCELEIELDRGRPEALEAFALRVAELTGWPRSTVSKLERALALAGVEVPMHPEDDTPCARAPDTVAETGRRVLRRHFERLMWHEPGTRAGIDPESLHDMRVAGRRMRAALRTFSDAFPATAVRRIDGELRWLCRLLGAVRDADVAIGSLAADRSSVPSRDRPALDHAIAVIDQRRRRARRALLAGLNARRFRTFVERVRRGLDAEACAHAVPWGSTPAVEAAPELAGRRYRQTRRALRRLPGKPAAEELHALRIRFKKLRYTCEFFSDLFGKPGRKFIRRMTALQDLLGKHHDEIALRDLLEGIRRRLRGPEAATRPRAESLARLARRHDRKAAKLARKFQRARKAFKGGKANRQFERMTAHARGE